MTTENNWDIRKHRYTSMNIAPQLQVIIYLTLYTEFGVLFCT